MREYILIISIHADPAMPPGYGEWGGTHTYMRELMDALEHNGIDCILVTRRALEELPEIETYSPHCTIYRLQNGPIAPINKTLLRNYHDENLRKIGQIIDACQSPPLVIHSVYWNSGRLGMTLSQKYHVPLVHSVISNSRGRKMRGAIEPIQDRAMFEQEIYEAAKWILCVSEDEKDDLVSLYHIAPEKMIVAGQYIHPSFILPAHDANGFPRLNSNISFAAQVLTAEKYNRSAPKNSETLFWADKAFTYFGRIDKSKGVDFIVYAWYRLYQRNPKTCPPLWLIGGGIPEIDQIRVEILPTVPELPELERQGKVTWWGCLDPIGASTLLLKTLVLLTNSLYEPGGRVIIEAMSEGVPVIAAPNGFAADCVRNWENGFLVDHGDVDMLARRMEHFVRQPFLSNALGLNAKETAMDVVRKWDFTRRHLQAYGLINQESRELVASRKNYFRCREIHLFPYQNAPLSKQLLASFLKGKTGAQILRAPTPIELECKSEIYRVEDETGEYIIKRPFTRLALCPLINPVQKQCYVLDAVLRYRREKAAYEARRDDILVGYDDFHHILLLREMALHTPTLEELPALIQSLTERALPLQEKQAEKYLDILRDNQMESVEGIETLLNSLSEVFPDYYFEASGFFSPHVGWNVAPHILAYNSVEIGTAHMKRLQGIVRFYSQRTSLPSATSIVEINTDMELRHICIDDGKWRTIDFENRSIGIVEYEIANLLFEFFSRSISENQLSWCKLMELLPEGCDQSQVLSLAAYRLFYETVLSIVMGTGCVEEYLSAIECLSELYEQI